MTTHAATVTRTELGFGSLSLIDSTYSIITLDPGDVPYRRENATSPYVSGQTEVGAVLDDAQVTLVVRVTGTSHSTLQSAISTLISAFRQSSYTLTLTLDGTSYSWTCKRANVSLVGGFDLATRLRYVARVGLSFPRSPVAVSGPI